MKPASRGLLDRARGARRAARKATEPPDQAIGSAWGGACLLWLSHKRERPRFKVVAHHQRIRPNGDPLEHLDLLGFHLWKVVRVDACAPKVGVFQIFVGAVPEQAFYVLADESRRIVAACLEAVDDRRRAFEEQCKPACMASSASSAFFRAVMSLQSPRSRADLPSRRGSHAARR